MLPLVFRNEFRVFRSISFDLRVSTVSVILLRQNTVLFLKIRHIFKICNIYVLFLNKSFLVVRNVFKIQDYLYSSEFLNFDHI